jgi:NACalpha-BTF3-like transcription factor
MADKQPRSVVEGATTGDVDEEIPASAAAKSAEDRKAASALASLDDDDGNSSAAANVDSDAASKAMKNLGGAAAATAAAAAAPRKNVKVDPADVTLLVDELELSKPRATELLKSHDGDAVQAMRAYVAA